MSDIVDRLRNWAGWPSTAEQRLGPQTLTQDCDAAAREIERLTVKADTLQFLVNQRDIDIADLRRLLRECEPAVYRQHMATIGTRIAKPETLLARVRAATGEMNG